MADEKDERRGFDGIYRDIGIYKSHLEWIRRQPALRGVPESVLKILAGYRESLGKGKLLDWLAPKSGEKILDNGCGVGYFIFDIMETNPSLELTFAGTEISDGALGILNQRMKLENRPNIIGVQCDIRALPFGENTFDAVVCSEVLDHTPTPWIALSEMSRVLKPSGRLLMTVPNGRAELFWDSLRSFSQKALNQPEGHETYYEDHLALDSVKSWIGKAGLRILKEELNTAIPVGTVVRRCPRLLQKKMAELLVKIEPLFRRERLATNYVVMAEKV